MSFRSGSLAYSTYLGGTGEDVFSAVTLDQDENIYATGFGYSTDFPTTAGAFQAARAGVRDALAVKIVFPTPTVTSTDTSTETPTPTETPSPTATPTSSVTATPTDTVTWSPSPTPSPTASPSPIPTSTPSPTPTSAADSCDLLFLADNVFRAAAEGTTRISVRPCQPGRLRLVIYNTAGEKVKVLRDDGYHDAQEVTEEWDGRNERDEPVSSGVYLVHFTGSFRADTKRLVVVR